MHVEFVRFRVAMRGFALRPGEGLTFGRCPGVNRAGAAGGLWCGLQPRGAAGG